jgi:hypothetical protein
MALDTRVVILVSQDIHSAVSDLADTAEVSMASWIREAIREKLHRVQAAALDAAQA